MSYVGTRRSLLVAPVTAAVNTWWLSGGISSANCFGAWQAKGAASLAASYVNLNNPGTNDLTVGGAPTFDTSTGWTFDGWSSYLISGLKPGPTMSAIVRFSSVASDGALIGSLNNYWFGFRPNLGGTTTTFYHSYRVDFTGQTLSGTMANAAAEGFVDGVSLGAIGTGGSDDSTYYLHIGRYYGAEERWLDGKIQAVAFYTSTLTSSQIAALHTAMMAL